MAKTKFEQELKKKPQGHLIAMCDQRDLDHTGNREALIAKLVEWEKSQPEEPEPEPEPKAEPKTEPEPEPQPEPES